MTSNELKVIALATVLAIAGLAASFSRHLSHSTESTPHETLVPQAPVRPIKSTIERPSLTDCLPATLADQAEIRILGAYEGGTDTPLKLAGDNGDVGRIQLQADTSGPPLVLIVSAYDPVLWDFSAVPVGRIRAVLATGYHDQAVAGLPKSFPLRLNSYNTPNSRCGTYAYAYEGGQNLDRLSANVRRIFGRDPDRFQGGYDPVSFHVDGGNPVAVKRVSETLLDEIRSSQDVSVSEVMPKRAGLIALINAGKIRPANANDAAALSRVLTSASPSGQLAPVELPESARYKLYVVLNAVTLPMGMYGAHSVTFIVPAGVPMPIDSGSHNTYYRLADGGCMGPMCSRE